MNVVLFDSSEGGALGWSWAVGSFRPGWTRIGAKSWDEATDKLFDAVRPGTRLNELQVWGHGQSGEPLIAGKPPTGSGFVPIVATLIQPESLVWFRSCSTFFGAKGKAFAERTANELGCRVAGHTHVIGPWQSGLYSLKPDQSARWTTYAEVVGGEYRDADWQTLKSGWRKPRTVFCLKMEVPEGW